MPLNHDSSRREHTQMGTYLGRCAAVRMLGDPAQDLGRSWQVDEVFPRPNGTPGYLHLRGDGVLFEKRFELRRRRATLQNEDASFGHERGELAKELGGIYAAVPDLPERPVKVRSLQFLGWHRPDHATKPSPKPTHRSLSPLVPVEHSRSPAGRASTTGRRRTKRAAPPRPVWCNALLYGPVTLADGPFTELLYAEHV